MAICEPKGTNEETRIIHQIVENDGLPLQPLELAAAFKKLTDYGWTIERISKSIGKSRTYITETIGLLGASRELRKAVEERKVSPTAARTLAKASPEKQRAAVEVATATGKKVTVQQAQRETTGKVTMFSAKAIRDAANQISAMLNSNDLHGPSTYWEGVRTGLQIAMGDTTIADAIDHQKTASIAA
jgi:ParB-like chromosome segregation protein Spo0J